MISQTQITDPKRPVSILFDACAVIGIGPEAFVMREKRALIMEGPRTLDIPFGGLDWERKYRLNDKYVM